MQFLMKVSYYAVARGTRVGVFRTWNECRVYVDGFPNARFKKFSTEREAKEFIEMHREQSVTKTIRKDQKVAEVVPMRAIGQKEYKAVDGATVVYTDGACSGNGQKKAKAGIGVFWGDGHPDNVAEPIVGKATNNRAEYSAIVKAIEKAVEKGIRSLIIRTDCNLVIKSMTLWFNAWKRNGWKTATGNPVQNQDLLERINELMKRLNVRFEKVQGHSDDYGNNQADLLAREGAKLYQRMNH